jgi:hypothetical protein
MLLRFERAAGFELVCRFIFTDTLLLTHGSLPLKHQNVEKALNHRLQRFFWVLILTYR